jgi:hypothetical protein
MKKLVTLSSLIMMFFFTFGQPVDRDHVIVEIGTGTGCPYCPGAAMGADDLVSNGHDVGIIEYHNYNSNDPFNNSYAAARTTYYGISGYPTAYFDGGTPVVGGSTNSSLYSSYLPKYNQHKAIPSDFTIDIDGESPAGQNYEVTIEIENVNNNTASNLRLQVVITESEIPYNWQGQSELNFVERRMMPDENGTLLDFSSGNTLSFNYTFSVESDWEWEHCQLVVFIQNHSSKQILQGAIADFEDLLTPLDNNAALYAASTPVTVCSETIGPKALLVNDGGVTMTSIDFTYSVNNGTEATYAWTGSLANDEEEWVSLPAIEIENMMEINTVEVSVGDPNGVPDEYPDNNVSTTTFEQSVDLENPPLVRLWIKTDNYPEETTWDLKNGAGEILYTGGPYDDNNHLYFTDFDITDIDCYSFTIYDAGGNGFMGDDAKYYMTHGTSGLIFYQDNEFSSQEEVQFGVGLVGIENTILAESFKVFPNPVQEEAWVMYETTEQASVVMNLYNLEGKMLIANTQNVGTGVHSIKIETNQLSNGVYFVELQVNNKSFKKKIVVNK